MPDDPVQSLTSRMAAGDAAAVEEFYRRYFDLMYREAARASGRDESFCLDVVQESMLRIIRSIRPVRSAPQLSAWLRLVVQTTAYDLIRGESRRRRREMAVAMAEPLAAATTDDDVDTQARATWLREQIASLDPQLVQMIELRYERRWTLARVADALGMSVGTVDGRLRRALKLLKSRAAGTNGSSDV